MVQSNASYAATSLDASGLQVIQQQNYLYIESAVLCACWKTADIQNRKEAEPNWVGKDMARQREKRARGRKQVQRKDEMGWEQN